MDRILVDTSGNIGVGIDSSNTSLAVRIKFPSNTFDLVQDMGRCGCATRFGEGNIGKHAILVTIEDFLRAC